MTVKFRDTGSKRVSKLLRNLAKKTNVRVGVIGDSARKEGEMSNVDLAIIHEYGVDPFTMSNGTEHPGIPKRSFIRDTFDENRARFQRNLRVAAGRVVEGADIVKQLSLFGVHVEGVIKKRISAGIPPPNKDSTKKRKGSSKPLIDTGQLRNSITSKVE